jgi:hypothetical protein
MVKTTRAAEAAASAAKTAEEFRDLARAIHDARQIEQGVGRPLH